MRTSTLRAAARLAAIVALATLTPAHGSAQLVTQQEQRPTAGIGEGYHIEVSGNLWNPALFGIISSEQFGLIGSDIDFTNDLGYERTRFKDLRIVLRPGKKYRFRAQYTPIVYTAETTLKRNIVFNGIGFPVSVPVESEFDWKVWRLGYEYDFVYTPRGFVGVLLETRMTTFSAELNSVIASEYTLARGPLPAAWHRRARLRAPHGGDQLRDDRDAPAEHRSEVPGELHRLGPVRHGELLAVRRLPDGLSQDEHVPRDRARQRRPQVRRHLVWRRRALLGGAGFRPAAASRRAEARRSTRFSAPRRAPQETGRRHPPGLTAGSPTGERRVTHATPDARCGTGISRRSPPPSDNTCASPSTSSSTTFATAPFERCSVRGA